MVLILFFTGMLELSSVTVPNVPDTLQRSPKAIAEFRWKLKDKVRHMFLNKWEK